MERLAKGSVLHLLADARARHARGVPAVGPMSPRGLVTLALARWKADGSVSYHERTKPGQVAQDLIALGDATLAQDYLTGVLPVDVAEDPSPALGALVDRFGALVVAPMLVPVLKTVDPARAQRHARLLAAVATRTDPTLQKVIHAGAQVLLALVLRHRFAAEGTAILLDLVCAAQHLEAGDVLDAVADLLRAEIADPATCQAEVLLRLAGLGPAWMDHPAMQRWHMRVVGLLTAETRQPPTPPANHARGGLDPIDCPDCRLLDAFLRDPAQAVARWPLRENRRRHLEEVLAKQSRDATTQVERRGSPYVLVATKTRKAYERLVARHRHSEQQLNRLRRLASNVP